MTRDSEWPEILEAEMAGRSTSPAALRSIQVHRGVDWLALNGHPEISAKMVRVHLDHREGVVPDLAPPEPAGAVALTSYYAEAISLGRKALAKLAERLDDADDPLTPAELLAVANLGGRYASSAALLRQRGASPLPGDEGFVPPAEAETPLLSDPMDGFLAGSAPAPSKRMGHSRVRVVEGVARPVADEGPKDRARYNERADQEGSPRL